jgi:CubicO group peptidase (beta-lactamase class C family)
MLKFLSLLLTLLVVVYPASSSPAQEGKQTFSELEKVALEEIKATNTPGAVVAVIHIDKVVFMKGYGVSNIETRTPVTPEMLFRIGSATKMFTAATLVTLFEEGRGRLDAPLGGYIKGLNARLSRISAHELLSHTAGINAELLWDGPRDESVFSPTLKARDDDFYIAQPGESFSYSNLGYAYAGLVIQEVSGKPYAESMREHLFQPLGMNRTTFRSNLAMTYPLSQGHNFDAASRTQVIVRPVVDNVIYWPAGYLWSNANDLAQFVIAFLNDGKLNGKRVLSPAVVRQLSTPYAEIPDMTTEGSTWKYGYGLTLYNFRGVHVVEHGGDSPGFGALIRMVPEHRFAVIILTNQSGVALTRTAERAMELMLPLKAKAESESGIALPLNNDEIAEMLGIYINADYKAEIIVKEGRPFFRAFGLELPITKTGTDRFSARTPGSPESENFVLRRSKDGKINQMQYALRIFKRVR